MSHVDAPLLISSNPSPPIGPPQSPLSKVADAALAWKRFALAATGWNVSTNIARKVCVHMLLMAIEECAGGSLS